MGSALPHAGIRDQPAGATSSAVKSAERTLLLIEYLATRDEPVAAARIVRDLGLPKSSLHGLLLTLENRGYVLRDRRGAFSLTGRLLTLGLQAAGGPDLIDVARPVMRRLSGALAITCNLGVMRGHEVVYIEKIDNDPTGIRLVTHVGGRLPAHATALGKSLLAGLPEDELETWLAEHEFDRLTEHTITSPELLRSDLGHARRRGYAVDNEESHRHVACLATPVFDATGLPVAALSITGLTSRVVAGDDWYGLDTLLESAREVSRLLGAVE